MLYVVHCLDRKDAGTTRADTRAAHLEYATTNPMLRMAGPLVGDDGASMIGSLLVLEAENEAAIREFVANDPYTRANLFETVNVHPWRWLFGEGATPPQAS